MFFGTQCLVAAYVYGLDLNKDYPEGRVESMRPLIFDNKIIIAITC